MGMAAAISNASPVWRFGNSREAEDIGFAEQTNRCCYIRLSDKLLLGRFGQSTLSETHSWAAAVLVNEFDAANFQSPANGQVIRRSH
jgi:hypothetical protein